LDLVVQLEKEAMMDLMDAMDLVELLVVEDLLEQKANVVREVSVASRENVELVVELGWLDRKVKRVIWASWVFVVLLALLASLVNRERLERKEPRDKPVQRVTLEIKVKTVLEVPQDSRENKESRECLEAVG